MNGISRGALPLAACAAVVLLLAGCNADEPNTIDEALKSSDRGPASTRAAEPSPSATGRATLPPSEFQAYRQAVDAAQTASSVSAQLYARGELDSQAERQLREVMMGRALHLTRGNLGVFEQRQWHSNGEITLRPLKPVQIRPGDANKSNGAVVFLACTDRSNYWIVGANGRRLEQEGSLRGVSRVAVYENEGEWRLSEIEPTKKQVDC